MIIPDKRRNHHRRPRQHHLRKNRQQPPRHSYVVPGFWLKATTSHLNLVLQGGFMAYASTASPFASVKGQNIFGGGLKPSSFSKGPSPSPSPSPMSSQISRFPTIPALGPPISDLPTSAPTAIKRTGFEAFSGSASPFASVARSMSPNSLSSSALRSKSPGRRVAAGSASKSTSAFTSYAMGGAQAFAVPVPKRARAGSPDGESSSSRGSLERNLTLSIFGNKEDEEDEEDRRRRDDGQLSFGEK